MNNYREVQALNDRTVTLYSSDVVEENPMPVGPAHALMNLLSDATTHMNETLGIETYDMRWRVVMRKKLNKLAGYSIKDFQKRVNDHGCDVNMGMNEMEEEEEMDDVRGLPEHCKEKAAPLRILGREARNWINTWNACGTGRDRKNFRERQWRKLRIIRADAYKKLGC